MLDVGPCDGPVNAAAAGKGIKEGRRSAAAKATETPVEARATVAPAPPAAPAPTTANTSSTAPREGKAAGDNAPASDRDTMLAVSHDEDEEEEQQKE